MISRILRYTLPVMTVLFMVLLIISMIQGYSGSMAFIIRMLRAEHYSEQIFSLISQDKFRILQGLLIVLVVVSAVLFVLFKPIYTKASILAKDLVTSVFRVYRSELSGNSKYLLIIPLIAAVIFAYFLPVSYDEAWTFNNFTDRGILSSIGYYPAPNNHILHSFITNLTRYLPFLPPLMKMRISAIFFGGTTILFTSYFLKKHFNEPFALVVAGVSATLFMTLYYSYMSRGYGLVMLCFIVSLYFVFNILKSHRPRRNFVFFSIFSVIGFYTMPSFLYPYILFNCIIFLKSQQYRKVQIISTLSTAGVVAFLYTPVIILNGISALINNDYVAPIERFEVLQRMPSFLCSSIEDITGFPWYIPFLLIIGSVIYTIRKKKRIFLYRELVLVFLLGPPILLIAHSVIPFSRTFNYYGFIFIFLIVLPFFQDLLRFGSRKILVCVVIIQFILVAHFGFGIRHHDIYSRLSDKIAEQIAGDHHYIVNSYLFDAYLLFELKTRGYSNYTLQYHPSIEMNTDSICNIDFIVIDGDADQTITREPIYENQFYNVIPAVECR